VSTVVGIHDGHNASVAVIRDGRIEIALQEERFSRVKNQGDAPRRSVDEALRLTKLDARETQVALNGRYMNYGQWQREKILHEYEKCSSFAGRVKQPLKGTFVDDIYQARKAGYREQEIAELGFRRGRMQAVEHHLAHASAAYYTRPWNDAKTLVLTCDGSGDRLSATVSVGENNQLRRLAEVSEHDSIGRLYALVTRHLGMAPLEHEYKVMGLAPYFANGTGPADRAVASAAEDPFSPLFEFAPAGLTWRRRKGVPSMYAAREFLAKLVAGRRFDWVAAAAQSFIERMLVRWVAHAVRETGIRKIVCSGGVFMNVKANLALLSIPEVEDVYVFPSCGDESNSIGAACHLAAHMGDGIRPLGGIYYGAPITDQEAEAAIEGGFQGRRLKARYVADIAKMTAEKLAEGKIVARAAGAMEFGARALGNRSILSRADSEDAVRKINRMVKNRDFWMPFAPSVLAERVDEYCIKPKPVKSPYMMFAFESRPEKRAAFCAAQHPYDFTARPHEVQQAHNPDYYRLLKEYEQLTGEGIVLNTSFNLHGEPVVYRAADAIDVFLRSGLEYMALGNWWVEKTGA
jgi:carbamoyltransferase